jgi:hypothetical protein
MEVGSDGYGAEEVAEDHGAVGGVVLGQSMMDFGDAEQHPRPPRARSELRVTRRARPRSAARFVYGDDRLCSRTYTRGQGAVFGHSRLTVDDIRGSKSAGAARRASRRRNRGQLKSFTGKKR